MKIISGTRDNSPIEEIIGLLTSDDDAAAVATFFEVCRSSPVFRGWLWQEFASSESTRTELARILDAPGTATAPLSILAALAGEAKGYARERSRLKKNFGAIAIESRFGGLSRLEVEKLIRRYQAGNIDGGAFLLAHSWRQHAGSGAGPSPRLLRASYAFLAEAAGRGRTDLLKEMAKALAFLAERRPGEIGRTAFGYAKWWKLSVLLYILNNPKPRYHVREFREHLAAQKVQVDPKDIRAFCKAHGIARDTRAGRPKKSAGV
jgi:hypothetical protein